LGSYLGKSLSPTHLYFHIGFRLSSFSFLDDLLVLLQEHCTSEMLNVDAADLKKVRGGNDGVDSESNGDDVGDDDDGDVGCAGLWRRETATPMSKLLSQIQMVSCYLVCNGSWPSFNCQCLTVVGPSCWLKY
jgi:hypothetical protein